jgi:hypothetical protein
MRRRTREIKASVTFPPGKDTTTGDWGKRKPHKTAA